ncbi:MULTISPECIES: site-specific integrase [unclassified Streptomyces]|uniref:tyrosine-type recombinase/integrase n=1 Tax=unclassified Streptomyces TaxID=2593676 RepID=UPI0022564F7A|nr:MULTISPECIES: site-specific integrase [unclassified Streptomyces]MCX4991354.1 site-specific integrase [Streptomyces sp. NBC_00568]MCX5003409.1 site-specific integrase [Streptomyces sp. NBC_00638]
MAGHIQDRWFKTENDADGKSIRTKSDRHGTGLRYRARYIGPDGTERSQSFPDGQKRRAEQWLTKTKADMDGGRYIDPKAGRITFRQYAEKWLQSQTTDPTTREPVGVQIRRHAIPYLGSRPLGTFKPEHIRDWLAELERAIPASSYRRVIFASVSGVFAAAVEDDHLHRNPCKSSTVRAPGPSNRRVVPWTTERTFAVRTALPAQHRAIVDLGAGCGLRQGEIFGLPADEIKFVSGWLHVAYQVKVSAGKLVFAPPKREKERDVPLADSVARALKEHMAAHPPVAVTLPWQRPDGRPVTKQLLFVRPDGRGALRRTDFNTHFWKPALVAAGVIPKPVPGERHQSAREHGMHALRHFYASVLLDAGENIKALSTYLGHTDPGFTLRVYTHLLPSSEGRSRKAVDSVFQRTGSAPDGPQTAQP